PTPAAGRCRSRRMSHLRAAARLPGWLPAWSSPHRAARVADQVAGDPGDDAQLLVMNPVGGQRLDVGTLVLRGECGEILDDRIVAAPGDALEIVCEAQHQRCH